MTDMLPCPFCGGEAEITKDYDVNCFGEEKVTLRAECAVCGAKPYQRIVRGMNDMQQWLKEMTAAAEFDLKEEWNKRVKYGKT